jgi:hypothetical protein
MPRSVPRSPKHTLCLIYDGIGLPGVSNAGRQLADSTVFLQCALSLAAFEISKAKDGAGNVLEPVPDRTSGVVTHPTPFPCAIRPRSAQAEALVRAFEEAR